MYNSTTKFDENTLIPALKAGISPPREEDLVSLINFVSADGETYQLLLGLDTNLAINDPRTTSSDDVYRAEEAFKLTAEQRILHENLPRIKLRLTQALDTGMNYIKF